MIESRYYEMIKRRIYRILDRLEIFLGSVYNLEAENSEVFYQKDSKFIEKIYC